MNSANRLFNDPILVIISDLNYKGDVDRAQIFAREAWYRNRARHRREKDRRYLYQRCSQQKWEEVKRAEERHDAREYYDKEIQKKYNVGPGWQNNRWFVEQVRPTL